MKKTFYRNDKGCKLNGLSIRKMRQLLRLYGGKAWVQYYNRFTGELIDIKYL